jgi:hypothetical protein
MIVKFDLPNVKQTLQMSNVFDIILYFDKRYMLNLINLIQPTQLNQQILNPNKYPATLQAG